MFIFSVKDMDESDSAVSIVKCVLHVDEEASVFVSMARHGVEITTERAGATQLSDAISDAGFTPALLPRGHGLAALGKIPPRIPFIGQDHDFNPGHQTATANEGEWVEDGPDRAPPRT